MRENVNMKWRKSDLVARAKELGIEGVSMMNKAKLVAAINGQRNTSKKHRSGERWTYESLVAASRNILDEKRIRPTYYETWCKKLYDKCSKKKGKHGFLRALLAELFPSRPWVKYNYAKMAKEVVRRFHRLRKIGDDIGMDISITAETSASLVEKKMFDDESSDENRARAYDLPFTMAFLYDGTITS